MLNKDSTTTFVGQETISRVIQVTSCFFWTLSFIYPNNHNMHFSETLIAQGAMGTLFNFVFLAIQNKSLDVKDKEQFQILSTRNFNNVVFRMAIIAVMFFVPANIVHTVASSATVSVTVMESILYGVSISFMSKIMMILSLVGISLQASSKYIMSILDPTYKFHSNFPNYYDITPLQQTGIVFVFWILVSIWSYSLIQSKYLKLSTYQINFQYNVQLVWLGAICYFFAENHSQISVFSLSFLTSGLLVALAQTLFIQALKMSHSIGINMILNMSNILFSELYSIFIYEESHDWISITGTVVLVFSISYVILDKYK